MRIKVVKSLKQHIQNEEIVYACHANLIACEENFNEQWFDVFLYYALIGLSNPRTQIRVYALNVLNTIAKHNSESILELTDKVHDVCRDAHWEIKAQAMQYAITILSSYKHMNHVLGNKADDLKGKKDEGAASPGTAKPAGGLGERNTLKGNLTMAVDIISRCFNLDSPKSVQKIGLFKLQGLLPDFKLLYPLYVDVLAQTDDDIKDILLAAGD